MSVEIDLIVQKARQRHALPLPVARRLIREQAGLSQAEVAEVLGVTAAAVSHYERGNRQPGRGVVEIYVELLNRLRAEVVG